MVKKILAAGGIGVFLYVIYDAWAQKTSVGNDDEGGFIDAALGTVQGGFMKVANLGNDLNMSISFLGLNHIKGWEGFRANVYLDAAGLPTIGYGHLIKPHESFSTITKEEATRLLASDVTDTEEAINRAVKVPLTQNQFDALCSLVFNIGIGAFNRSTMLKELNKGNYDKVAAHIPTWRMITVNGVKQISNGLVNRRASDLAVWTSSNYRTA
jgi:lysozyme